MERRVEAGREAVLRGAEGEGEGRKSGDSGVRGGYQHLIRFLIPYLLSYLLDYLMRDQSGYDATEPEGVRSASRSEFDLCTCLAFLVKPEG